MVQCIVHFRAIVLLVSEFQSLNILLDVVFTNCSAGSYFLILFRSDLALLRFADQEF